MDTGILTDEIFDTYGMHFHGIAPEICVGYSRLKRFGNNQKMRPDEPNIVIDPGSYIENRGLPSLANGYGNAKE